MEFSYDCAFLVYEPLRQRRKDNSFDGNDNIGAKVIERALVDAGLKVGYVTASTAQSVPVVLVSLTSTYDIYAFLRSVYHERQWQPEIRKFQVFVGGFGMQNPIPIRDYIDYAAFGRAHVWVAEVVRRLLHHVQIEHESIMDIRKRNPVVISQAPLYDERVDGFKESFTGCPLKCKFCHYTFARKHQGSDESYNTKSYVQTTLTSGSTPEVTWDQLLVWAKKAGRVRVAIDGFSERLRYLYGKHISNQDIVDGINQMGSFGPNATTLLVYNIANFPAETLDDYQEFVDTVSSADPKYRVIVVLHSTPFRPSLATPMQWEVVNLFPDWSKYRAKEVVERRNLRVVHSFTLETPWSHLRSVIAERAGDEDDDAIKSIQFSRRLRGMRHDKALSLFERNFDINRWIGERDIESEPPAPFLSGYIDNELIRRIARKMRRRAFAPNRN